MESKFKIGDKVVVNRNCKSTKWYSWLDAHKEEIGKIFTIKSVYEYSDANSDYKLQEDIHGLNWDELWLSKTNNNIKTIKKYTESIRETLIKMYPDAREGFIDIIIEMIDTHAKKNHDYNGSGSKMNAFFYDAFGVEGRLFDIWRKIQRLYHIIRESNKPLVNEKTSFSSICSSFNRGFKKNRET